MTRSYSIRKIVLSIVCFISIISTYATDNPKREFRGAWLHIIGQSQYQGKTLEELQAYISEQIEKLHTAGCNAVIFQVRPTADAMYISDIEPWTSWFTGKRGLAPQPLWDPMSFAIEEAHKHGMEFHAWLNPYRVTSSAQEVLPSDHLSRKEPHRFFKYDGKVFFDPAYEENRELITNVVIDIVDRYDVDGIHIDDYFYPYPVAGHKFNADNESYEKFGNGLSLNDWRRHNVDLLIEKLYTAIKKHKPWVRFGVSPFGIWRNQKNDPRGSESNGLQNYDDLYADVLLWAKNGWIDYIVPQLYWELDHKAAPSRKLVKWWNDNIHGVDLYIGQDVQRTMNTADQKNNDRNELDTKVQLTRSLTAVGGNVWWHGYWVTGNYKGVADSLALKYQSTIALPPLYGDKNVIPNPVSGLKIKKEEDRYFLCWDSPTKKSEQSSTDAIRYVVYEIFDGEPEDISDSQSIVALTPYCRVEIDGYEKGVTFLVTALDRMNRESKPARIHR